MNIDSVPSQQEIIEHLRDLYHSLLGTTRGRIRANDTVPFVCALLDPHAPMGCQFIYPEADPEYMDEAIEQLNTYLKDTQPYGTVALECQETRVIFSLLTPGFVESYYLPITPGGDAEPVGPIGKNLIAGLRFFRVA